MDSKSKRLSVTIPEHQEKFLNETNFSASALLQRAIEEQIISYNSGNTLDKNVFDEIKRGRDVWKNNFDLAMKFIREKGFEIEFAERLGYG